MKDNRFKFQQKNICPLIKYSDSEGSSSAVEDVTEKGEEKKAQEEEISEEKVFKILATGFKELRYEDHRDKNQRNEQKKKYRRKKKEQEKKKKGKKDNEEVPKK